MYTQADYSRQLEILSKVFDGSNANLASKCMAANWLKKYAIPVHTKFSKSENPIIAKFHSGELDKIYASIDFWDVELKNIFSR